MVAAGAEEGKNKAKGKGRRFKQDLAYPQSQLEGLEWAVDVPAFVPAPGVRGRGKGKDRAQLAELNAAAEARRAAFDALSEAPSEQTARERQEPADEGEREGSSKDEGVTSLSMGEMATALPERGHGAEVDSQPELQTAPPPHHSQPDPAGSLHTMANGSGGVTMMGPEAYQQQMLRAQQIAQMQQLAQQHQYEQLRLQEQQWTQQTDEMAPQGEAQIQQAIGQQHVMQQAYQQQAYQQQHAHQQQMQWQWAEQNDPPPPPPSAWAAGT